MVTRFRSRGRWLLLVGVLLIIPGLASGAQIVNIDTLWPKGENLKKPSNPIGKRFTITGPGRLEVHLDLDPYRGAGIMANKVWDWNRYNGPGGKPPGWTKYFNQIVPGNTVSDKTYVGGKESGKWLEGVPWKWVFIYDVAPGTYDLGFQLSPPCHNYGGLYTQWAQKTHLVITYSPGGAVPDVRGQDQAQAAKTLAAAGLKLKVLPERVPTANASQVGRIAEQSPAAGTKVAPNTAVAVKLYQQALAKVPGVVGVPKSQAMTTLQKAGFTVTVSQEKANTKQVGFVIRQSPEAGKMIKPGSRVTIVIGIR